MNVSTVGPFGRQRGLDCFVVFPGHEMGRHGEIVDGVLHDQMVMTLGRPLADELPAVHVERADFRVARQSQPVVRDLRHARIDFHDFAFEVRQKQFGILGERVAAAA